MASSSSVSCGTRAGGVTCIDALVPGRPATVHTFPEYPAERVDTGPFHGCGLRMGKVACWGSGDDGQAGYWGHRETPTEMTLPFRVDEIAAGRSHTCLRSGGTLYCLGSNSHGQMATPPTDDVFPSPVRIDLR